MATSSTKPPTTEIGNANLDIRPWSAFFDEQEDVPELRWPKSIKTYDHMRNDPQIEALWLALTLPIRRYRWYIDPNGARDEVVQLVADDFNLPIEGQEPGPSGRQRDRFSHGDHLRQALLSRIYGSFFFEQVYRLGDDNRYHLRKLAPRMPGSIYEIIVDLDGGLNSIVQYPAQPYASGLILPRPLGAVAQRVQIPVLALVAYVCDREGANWRGRSMLRSLYRNYIVKDRLMRVDALKHERNGMGIPMFEAPPGATKKQIEELSRMAQQYKAGEGSGGALPNGTKPHLMGVEGSLPDTLASMNYHDEQMARRFLAMFVQLGQTKTGSRALGDTFSDFFALGQEAIATDYCDVTNQHVIEDMVDANWSIDEGAPLIKFSTDADKQLAVADLVAMVEAGLITVDLQLEEFLRAEYNLTEIPEELRTKRMEEALTPDPAPPLPEGGDPTVKPSTTNITASRGIAAAQRRAPTDTEEQAGVDFEAIRAAFDSSLSELVADWSKDVKPAQVTELTNAIAVTPASDVTALGSLTTSSQGQDLLAQAMTEMATSAISAAIAEAEHQGVSLSEPDRLALDAELTTRANTIASMMAGAISQSAANAAVPLGGGALTSSEIAEQVGEHLDSLTDAYLKQQLGGALMQAQNMARMATFATGPVKRYYSSELDDKNTCVNCAAVDGTEYDTIEAASDDYPSGGYKDCLGGLNCRGTIIAIFESESEPSVQ